MRFAIYSRKSKFTGKGESIENQIEMCKDYISTHFPDDKPDISIYEDEGFSGKNLNRPKFQEMMVEENKNPFDYIVVYRLDRISRNVGDFATLIDKLNDYSTSFICIKEQFDTSTPMGRAMMNIASVFAQLERETIAERVKDNMYMLAKDGRWTGGTTPLGYKSVKCTQFINTDKRRSYYVLEFDKEQIDLAKLIFKKYVEIQSVSGVQTYLREHGYKTRNGNEWDKSNLKRVLTNPIYCIADEDSYNYFNEMGCNVCFTLEDCDNQKGILPYNRVGGNKRKLQPYDKWLITVSRHKGILSGKQWVKVQRIITSNSKNIFGGTSETRKALNPKSILSGVLFCSCGAYMRPKIYGSGNMYYICETKERTKSQDCQMQNINGDELDKLVLNELFSYNLSDNSINKQIQQIKNKISEVADDTKEILNRLKKKKQENEQASQNLVTALSMNVSVATVKAINEQIDRLSIENQNLDMRINELSVPSAIQDEMKGSLNTIIDALEYLKNNFNQLSIENKRDFIKRIIDKIIWDGENIHIFIKGVS